MEASTRPGKTARTASTAISCRTLKISHPRPPRCLRSLQNRQRRPHKHQTLQPASPTFRASFRNRTATAANLARNTTAAVRFPRRVQNQLHSAVERRRLRENFRTSQRTATDSPALSRAVSFSCRGNPTPGCPNPPVVAPIPPWLPQTPRGFPNHPVVAPTPPHALHTLGES